MSTSADARPLGARRRRRRVLGASILLLSGAAALAFWLLRSSAAPPAPPEIPPDPAEPEVVAFLAQSRQRVLKEPRSAQAWGTLGQAFLGNEMEEECRVCCAQAERLDPSNPRWPYYQGGIFLNRGDRDAALPLLRRAAELCAAAAPNNPAPPLRLAETLLALGQVDQAEECVRQVAQRQPEDPRCHFDLALIALARQDWPSGKARLLSCLNSPFARQKASVQLAAVCRRLGEASEAERYAQQANRLPADTEWDDPYLLDSLRWAVKKRSRYRLVELLEGTGRLREALATLQPLLEQYPNDYLPHLTAGKLLGQLGENQRAIVLLRQAVRLAPNMVQPLYYLSLVLFSQAKQQTPQGHEDDAVKDLYRESIQLARQALAIKPDYGYAYMPLGLSLKRLGQRTEALAALRQSVRCNPEYAELHFHLGVMLAEAHLASEARDQLQQAVQMAPPQASWLPDARARLASLDAPNKPPAAQDG